MVFVAEAFASWLVSQVANAGRKRLTTLVLGSEQERALRKAAAEAVKLAAKELHQDEGGQTEQTAMVIDQVFRETLPPATSEQVTLLQALHDGVASQLAVLGDAGLTGTGTSSAALLGVPVTVLGEKLTSHLLREILRRGASGGPLAPLADQLNHDRTHLQGQRLEGMITQLGRATSPPAVHLSPPAVHLSLIGQLNPFALGVHRAISADEADLPELPPYVRRTHDERLGKLIDAASRASGLVVLVGDSSTGKTRALWESIGRLPQPWQLWAPASARALNQGLAGTSIGSHTVVWLNDAHHYLDPTLGELAEDNAARLRDLIRNPSVAPVVMVATFWPEKWQQLTAQSRGGTRRDVGAQVADLLDGAAYLRVPSYFHGHDLETMTAAATLDPRLALAMQHAGHGKITQYLAGAQKVLERYDTVPPEIRAMIDAAIDARRLGHANRLPQQLLVEVASGYIDDEAWNRLGDRWEAEALRAAALDWRGLDGPLTRIRPRPGDPAFDAPTYRLADVLEQVGTNARLYTMPPAEFWAAAARWYHGDDLATLAREAELRGRYRLAASLYLRAANAGTIDALVDLAWMRERTGQREEGEQLLNQAADAGSADALLTLAARRRQVWEKMDRESWSDRLWNYPEQAESQREAAARYRDEAERFYRRSIDVATGLTKRLALWGLAELRLLSGDREGADHFYEQAHAIPDTRPLYDPRDGRTIRDLDQRHLAEMRRKFGLEDTERRYRRDAADGDIWAMRVLGQLRQAAGDRNEAEHLYQRAAEAGNIWAMQDLARSREQAGDHTAAERFFHQALDAGDADALAELARMREARKSEEAQRLREFGVDVAGDVADPWALEEAS